MPIPPVLIDVVVDSFARLNVANESPLSLANASRSLDSIGPAASVSTRNFSASSPGVSSLSGGGWRRRLTSMLSVETCSQGPSQMIRELAVSAF